MDEKIPRILHYCWFGGGPLPEADQRCIESWRRFCPDYEIVEWNERNFDVTAIEYVREAYEAGKWAFVSDVARLNALVQCGGIYLDTDVELCQPLDDFLRLRAFCGLESPGVIATALIGCEKGFPLIRQLLETYTDDHFRRENGELNTMTNVKRFSQMCEKLGLQAGDELQTIAEMTVFPQAYFCPKDYSTGIMTRTPDTHAIHHYSGSWWTEEKRYSHRAAQKLMRIFPERAAQHIARVAGIARFRGPVAAAQACVQYFRKDK